MAHYDAVSIPGTTHILALQEEVLKNSNGQNIKQDGNIILVPQPSDSPNDPLNWSKWRKFYHFLLVSYITGLTAATSNDAGATQDDLNEKYGISYNSMNTGAGVLFIGIGYAVLILSPTASLYGRRIAYLFCILCGLLGAVWFAQSKKTSDTIWSQLFVGISESCAEGQVQLSLTDIYFQHQIGSAITVYILATSVGTYLGPLIASFIVEAQGFRWVGWWAVIISGATLVVLGFSLEETYFDRSKFLTKHYNSTADSIEDSDNMHVDDKEKGYSKNGPRARTDNVSQISSGPHDCGASDPKKPFWKRIALITPSTNIKGLGFKQYVHRLLHTCRVFAFPAVIYSGLQWGAQDAWLSFYLTTEDDEWYGPPWNYGNTGVGLMNVPCLIGAIIGCIYGGSFSDYFVLQIAKKRNGIMEAEDRLWLMLLAGIISPTGMFLFGIGSAKGMSWPMPYVGLGLIGFGWGCAGDLSMSYLMDAYPEMVLEGMVGVAVINNSLACIFTFVCSYWLESAGTQNSYIAIGVLDFFFIMLTIPMIMYGKKCRLWTKDYYNNFVQLRDGL